MKVLVSTAVWGESYRFTFTKFSLATLLSEGNIPDLAKSATIIFHIVTTHADREFLKNDPGILELQRYCHLEWEVIEDFGVMKPPQGPGGQKYPFLSALQNIAIARSSDQDAIVFNYADFIWADGSLSGAVNMLAVKDKLFDAVLSFCIPVDRDSALLALEQHRQSDAPAVIRLAPREGIKIAIEHIHREAKIRFWDEAPRFTNLPSYLIWRVGEQGLLIRAYHQSILAMRVRPDDPEYIRGILRGGLDSGFSAQLAKRASCAFATDTNKILVFSLYQTPVDSRAPIGVTREMSLRNLLTGEVTPEQRSFAEHPIYLKVKDGDEAEWKHISETSWHILRAAQDSTPFNQAVYDENYETHGVIPRLTRLTQFQKHIRQIAYAVVGTRAGAAIFQAFSITRSMFNPKQRQQVVADIRQYIYNIPGIRRARRIGFVLWHPPLLLGAIERRLARWLLRRATPDFSDEFIEARFLEGNTEDIEAAFLRRAWPFNVAPNIEIEPVAFARYMAAIFAEGMTARVADTARLTIALRTAEELLRQAIAISPIWIEPVRALGRNLWFQGRFDEAIQAFADAEPLRDAMAKAAGWQADTCIFLPRNCAEVIGLMGHIDAFAKYKILTGDPRPYYLLAPEQGIVNAAFLDYWKDYIEVESRPSEIGRMSTFEPVYGVNWNWVMPKDGKIVFVHEAIAAIQRAWYAEGRAPLLQLRQDHAAALSSACSNWGMKEGDRYVCLHVRSMGFYGASRESAQRFRNVSIESYYPLIRALTEMGFWVIRMGDPSMPPLDLAQCGNSGRVVDYALSPEKSAELDVALCARCELFVSTNSGLHTVAHSFDRPVCGTNHAIYSGVPWHPGDVFIPQLYYSHAKGRVLTLEEILGTNVVHLDHHFLLEREELSLIPNDPDDIVETIREALSPSTYRVEDPDLADKVCAKFEELNRDHDIGISGRLGRYFAMKYASQLLPSEQERVHTASIPKKRKLDILIPVFNRPKYLHRILKTGLELEIPGAYFVVFDDASNSFEEVPNLGFVTVEMVCRSFNDERVIYMRNPTNIGVAKSLKRYYLELCDAEYTSLLNPKDEFINAAPIISALAKLDADPKLSFVVYALRQVDRVESDKVLSFHYDRMSGRDFIAAHVRDTMLQHCGAYSILRVAALRRCGIPRDLDLRAHGLEDASGIDHEMLFNLATTGDVEFESEAPVRRTIVDGYTERYPLTFAYCQYQYARRLMAELEPRGFVTAETRRLYLGFWHLIIARGLRVAYSPVHGSEQERGVSRIRPHLSVPILLYLPLEALRFRVWPRWETVTTYFAGARLLLADWLNKIRGRPHIA